MQLITIKNIISYKILAVLTRILRNELMTFIILDFSTTAKTTYLLTATTYLLTTNIEEK